MIYFYTITASGQLTTSLNEEEADWLHIEKPTTNEMNYYAEKYHFPHDYLSAVLDNQEISRLEGFKQARIDKPLLQLLQYPKVTASPSGFKQVESLPFSMILTSDKLITSCNDELDMEASLQTKQTLPIEGTPKEKIMIQLAWYFSDLFNESIRSIKDRTDILEQELQESTENKQLFQLMDMQKSLVYFDSALEQNLLVIEQVYTSDLIMTSKQSRTALYDIIVETKQALASAKIQAELLAQLGNLFSAIVSNNMNMVMKVLTVITIVLTIPTIVGGIYGMNVELPFANEANAFWWLLLITAIFSLLTFWFLKKKKFF